MHINELLCYATYHLNNSNINNIKTIIRSFYSSDDLSNAKKMLWDLCSDSLEPYTERRNTENRTSQEANISDIFDALCKLDALEKTPVFVARDVSMIPDRQPEKLNLVSIINRLSSVEKKMTDYDDVLSKHEIELQNLHTIDIESKLRKLEPSKENFEKYKLFISDGDSTIQINREVAAEESSSTDWEFLDEEFRPERHRNKNKRKKNEPSKQSKPDNFTNEFVNNESKNVLNTFEQDEFHRDYNHSSMVSNEHHVPSTFFANAVDDEGFQLKESRKQRKRRFEYMNQLQGAPPPTRLLFLSRITNGNFSSVDNYLRSKNVKLYNIVLVSHNDAKYNSYKISVSLYDIAKVLDASFWPTGIKCRRWRDKEIGNSRKISNYEFFNSKFKSDRPSRSSISDNSFSYIS